MLEAVGVSSFFYSSLLRVSAAKLLFVGRRFYSEVCSFASTSAGAEDLMMLY